MIVVAAAVVIAFVTDGSESAAQSPAQPVAETNAVEAPARVVPRRHAPRIVGGFAPSEQTFADQPEPAGPIEPSPSLEQQPTALPNAGSQQNGAAARPTPQQIERLIAQSQVRAGAPGAD